MTALTANEIAKFDRMIGGWNVKAVEVHSIHFVDADGFTFVKHFVIGTDAHGKNNEVLWVATGEAHVFAGAFASREALRDEYRYWIANGWTAF